MTKRISEKKMDILLGASAYIIEKNAVNEFLSEDYTIITMPESLKRKIHRMNAHALTKREALRFITVLRKITAVILILMTVSFMAIMNIDSVRAALFNTIAEWYDKYIAVYFIIETDSEIPTNIEQKKEPEVLENGYTKAVLIDSQTMYAVKYTSAEISYTYTQSLLDEHEIWIDDKQTSARMINTAKLSGYLFCLNDKNEVVFVWNDGEYAYTLQSVDYEGQSERLIEIAESVH